MPAVPLPDDLLQRLEGLERRLRDLETAPQQPNRTQKGGSFKLIPPDGVPASLFTFGEFTHPTTGEEYYGVVGYDNKGDVVLALREGVEGLQYPHEYAPWRPDGGGTLSASGAAKITTNAAFETLFETYMEIPAFDCFYTLIAVTTPVGTTGELKLVSSAGSTATYSIGSGASGTVQFNWLHPFSVGWGDDTAPATARIEVHARRTGGAGDVSVFWPTMACWRASNFANGTAAADGNPTLL